MQKWQGVENTGFVQTISLQNDGGIKKKKGK